MIFLISANIRKKCIPAEPSQTDDWFMASFLEHCGQKYAIRLTSRDVYRNLVLKKWSMMTAVHRGGHPTGIDTKKPGRLSTSVLPKNGGDLLSQLVGQYHRRG